ncbi:Myosin 10A, isoform D [Chytridiales sp. JEL 0842]|nr:Myosin 10A, isoform D [Chytridiales sp. JEL 0842]
MAAINAFEETDIHGDVIRGQANSNSSNSSNMASSDSSNPPSAFIATVSERDASNDTQLGPHIDPGRGSSSGRRPLPSIPMSASRSSSSSYSSAQSSSAAATLQAPATNSTSPATTTIPLKSKVNITYARAIFDFTPNTKDEIALEEQDLLIVQNRDPANGGWWFGTNHGCRGWFPGSYVEVLTEEEVREELGGGVQGEMMEEVEDKVDNQEYNGRNVSDDDNAGDCDHRDADEDDHNTHEQEQSEDDDAPADQSEAPASASSSLPQTSPIGTTSSTVPQRPSLSISSKHDRDASSSIHSITMDNRSLSGSSIDTTPSTHSSIAANSISIAPTASSVNNLSNPSSLSSKKSKEGSWFSKYKLKPKKTSGTQPVSNEDRIHAQNLVGGSLPSLSRSDSADVVSNSDRGASADSGIGASISHLASDSTSRSRMGSASQDRSYSKTRSGSIKALNSKPTSSIADLVRSSNINMSISNKKSMVSIIGSPAELKKSWVDYIGGPEALEKLDISKQERQRQEVIYEIICTERDYVADLETIVEVYMKPLRNSKAVRPKDMAVIFSNVEALLPVNMELLKQLEVRQSKSNGGVIEQIGDVFIGVSDFLKMYTMYCSNHPYALMKLQAVRQSKSVAKQLDQYATAPECRSLDLSTFLLKPCQRICKYPLLIREVIKATDTMHPDSANLLKALLKIETVVTIVNEGSRQADTVKKMLELQNRFTTKTNIVTPSRILKKNGTLDLLTNKDRKRREVYLFNDTLLMGKPQGSNNEKLKVVAMVPFDMMLVNSLDDEENGRCDMIEVIHVGVGKFTLAAESPSAKESWMKALMDAIDSWMSSKRTLQQKVDESVVVTGSPALEVREDAKVEESVQQDASAEEAGKVTEEENVLRVGGIDGDSSNESSLPTPLSESLAPKSVTSSLTSLNAPPLPKGPPPPPKPTFSTASVSTSNSSSIESTPSQTPSHSRSNSASKPIVNRSTKPTLHHSSLSLSSTSHSLATSTSTSNPNPAPVLPPLPENEPITTESLIAQPQSNSTEPVASSAPSAPSRLTPSALPDSPRRPSSQSFSVSPSRHCVSTSAVLSGVHLGPRQGVSPTVQTRLQQLTQNLHAGHSNPSGESGSMRPRMQSFGNSAGNGGHQRSHSETKKAHEKVEVAPVGVVQSSNAAKLKSGQTQSFVESGLADVMEESENSGQIKIQKAPFNKPVKKATIIDVKRMSSNGTQSKDYVYILRVAYVGTADNTYSLVHHTFDDFFDFHLQLIGHFPEEAGLHLHQTSESARIIPELPAQMMFVSETVAKSRTGALQEYVSGLIALPFKVSRSPVVMQFFRQDGKHAMSATGPTQISPHHHAHHHSQYVQIGRTNSSNQSRVGSTVPSRVASTASLGTN